MNRIIALFTFAALLVMLGLAGSGLVFAAPDTAVSDDELDFEGLIESFPAGLSGEWVVDGQTFIANNGTEFDTEDGPFAVGVCVDINYIVVNEVQTATRIRTDYSDVQCDNSNDDDDNKMQIYGRLESFPAGLIGEWVVDGVTYTADSQTEFDDDDDEGDFFVGVCIEVEYDPITNLAHEIEREDDYKCDGQNSGILPQTEGLVESFPAGLVGEWIISGVTYQATAVTEFETDDGPFFVGGCVEVKFDPNNNNLAYEIETEDDDCDDDDNAKRKIYGQLESRPQGTLLGDWVVNGASYTADAQTEFDDDDDDGDFIVGACLSIEYSVTPNGNLAREIETEDGYKCQNGSAANRYEGRLESFPPSLYGVWVIDGLSFMTDPSTDFDDDDNNEDYQIGDCIEVKYLNLDGVNKVIELENEDDDDDCDGLDDDDDDRAYQNKLYATIDSFPAGLVGEWVIGGQTFTATVTTEFDDDDNGNFAIGQCVQAEYNNQLLLHEVETEADYKCMDNGTAVSKLYGTVNQLPPAPFVGQWVVAGQTIQVTTTTQLEQQYGLFGVGAFVEVKYVRDGNTAVATKIETHVAPDAALNQRVGIVNSFDSNDSWQDWTISGQTYKASPVISVNRQPETNNRVIYRSYDGLDGQTYLTSITAASDVYLPLLSSTP